MLFKERLAYKIIWGDKTQTRRLVKPGDFSCNRYGLTIPDLDWWHQKFSELLTSKYVDNYAMIVVKDKNSRDRYVVQKDYAVQMGRGKPGIWWGVGETGNIRVWETGKPLFPDRPCVPARIKFTDIRREDVRNITQEDAIAEGFKSRLDFLSTWCSINDRGIQFYESPENALWYRVHLTRGVHPIYHGWVTFTIPQLLEALNNRPLKLYDAWALNFKLVPLEVAQVV